MKIRIENGTYSKEVDIYTNEGLGLIAELWLKTSCQHKIMYEPTWLGIPVIQYPSDIIMLQELIWKVRPDVVVETGTAHGGSAIFFASMLELLGKGKVISIDIEIRKYNELAVKSHPLSKRIHLIEGNSVDKDVISQVNKILRDEDKVLVVCDSNHSYNHVLREMELYSTMVSAGSYMVVMDGAQAFVWDIPNGKPEWKENNPLKAIEEFIKNNPQFTIDPYYNRLRVTANPKGFLRRLTEEEIKEQARNLRDSI